MKILILIGLIVLSGCQDIIPKKTITTDGVGAGRLVCDRRTEIPNNGQFDLAEPITIINPVQGSFCVIHHQTTETFFLVDSKSSQHITLEN
jgi:hypothetical protein